MGPCGKLSDYFQYTVATFLLFALWLQPVLAQDAVQKPVEKPAAESAEKASAPEKAVNPAQIELLETKVRFESNGDSRKEVHALVKINSELGVRQFAKLNFDYNRSFESIQIPLVHITHASGGTADILPSAITDQPNPAVVNAPAYQDVRVKSVRVLGLEPGDTLEYRVITTVSHHPLAPDFWLDHSFDRTGVVTQEIFAIDLPASRFEAQIQKSYPPSPSDPLGIVSPLHEQVFRLHGMQRSPKPGRVYISPRTSETSKERLVQQDSTRLIYRWNLNLQELQKLGENQTSGEMQEPDVALSTFGSWADLAIAMGGGSTRSRSTLDLEELREKAAPFPQDSDPIRSIYARISAKIRTIDLPFDSFVDRPRNAFKTLANGYGTADAKAFLFEELTAVFRSRTQRIFFSPGASPENQVPRPTVFSGVLLEIEDAGHHIFLDPGMEVAPFGLLSANMRGGKALQFDQCALDESHCWIAIPKDPPFASTQRVNVDATLAVDEKLTAKVHYSMRGDNELLLRMAFHQSPKEKWKELAQLLSITDGFRGHVTSVHASDPYATKEPFRLEYEIEQPKFVNWSKKFVRIPALLPQIGLPDPPAKPPAGAAVSPIDLGTPLEVETQMTLRLPAGTAVQTPTGTSVQRDYATYASQYSAKGPMIKALRHINFLLRQIPADRAADYGAFLHAVQNDEAQDFTLEQPNPSPLAPKQAEVKTPSPNKTEQPKP
ncbi:MAG TPA: DUF3857 domain-containing protein [Candidatus Acidoferrum sp.]|nr:DUF3857 domain-containing protein [Candidatus Acidoferrum sp.]